MPTYDLAVVGAGPAGLMAARTAAENGLKVVLLERNKEVAPVKRGCGMVLLTLNEPYFGEEKICLNREKGELSFPSQGFSVTYEGPSRDLFSWHIFSPGGELAQFGDTQNGLALGEDARTSAVHDKGALLQGLLRDCEELGVNVLLGTNVAGVEKKREKVHVVCEVNNLEVSYVIAADGVNSRLAQALELNRERTYYGLMKIQGVELEGVEKFDTNTFYSFVTGSEHPTYSVLIPLAGQADGGFRAFTVVFDPEIDVAENLQFFLTKSLHAPFFKNSRIMTKTSSVENIFSPMKVPYRDQVLFIGDAAWCQEIEITSALMCGWNAGNVIASALKESKIGKDGVESYLHWWDTACMRSHDYRNYLRNYALCFLMTDEEIDYLFSQVNAIMPAIFNPYRAFDLLGEELAGSMEKISKERPDIFKKIQTFSSASMETLMEKPMKAALKL
jgi:digeranylgeranylglycerophospholipid reductase